MARYDYYRDADRNAFFLDVQSDMVEILNSRVVVPLLPPRLAPMPARRLNPIFKIDGGDYVMVTQFISALPAAELPQQIGNLDPYHDQIVAALDMLFQGF